MAKMVTNHTIYSIHTLTHYTHTLYTQYSIHYTQYTIHTPSSRTIPYTSYPIHLHHNDTIHLPIGLNTAKMVTNQTYNNAVNKYKDTCGGDLHM